MATAMTAQSTLVTSGQDAALISTTLSAVLSPKQFERACQMLVAQHSGHAAHRALDRLVTDLLSSLGYGDGMAVFLAHVSPYHAGGA